MATPENQSSLNDERGDARSVARPAALSIEHLLAWCVTNRDLTHVEFLRRVLEEALDESEPLLERLKFLTIFSSNLDEFFMVRVSGLKEMLDYEDIGMMPGELMPAEQLKIIRERLLPILDQQMRCLRDEVLPGLAAKGVVIAPYGSLSQAERQSLDDYFMQSVYPVLTPMAVDSAHPFPYISGLSLNIGLTVEPLPMTSGITKLFMDEGEIRFVRIKVPPVVPRLIPVDREGTKFTLLEDLIEANIHSVFPRMRAGKGHMFRVTRDADIEIRDDKAADLLGLIKQSLRERRFGQAVRLEVSSTMPPEMVEYLRTSTGLEADDVYVLNGPLNVQDLMALYDLDKPDLKDKPLRSVVPAPLFKSKSFFSAIKKQDILLHHPYTSYTTVTDFIQMAAKDPDVLAIKICLYRTGHHSPIPQALMEASESGKQVTAVVEIKARFDEARNIEWAKRLEESGVHVVYGLMGLKTHCKVALIVRREKHGLQTYVHIATGNYNPTTSRVYTDLGLLTTNVEIGDDVTDLFNFLTGFSRQNDYTRLLVAPVNLRARMLALIEREITHANEGRTSGIAAKINRLTDFEIIKALYRASRAGVPINLIVRGTCMLRPGIPGLSDTIHVRSIVGRFLEHSRLFYFANGGDEDIYIGSADWMARNLDRRVEVITPVLDAELKRYLKDVVLDTYLRDNVKARILKSDGTYESVPVAQSEERLNSQLCFEGHISLD